MIVQLYKVREKGTEAKNYGGIVSLLCTAEKIYPRLLVESLPSDLGTQ